MPDEEEGVRCTLDPLSVAILVVALLSVIVAAMTIPAMCCSRILVEDMRSPDWVTIDTVRDHGIRVTSMLSLPIVFHGTGHPLLDAREETTKRTFFAIGVHTVQHLRLLASKRCFQASTKASFTTRSQKFLRVHEIGRASCRERV